MEMLTGLGEQVILDEGDAPLSAHSLGANFLGLDQPVDGALTDTFPIRVDLDAYQLHRPLLACYRVDRGPWYSELGGYGHSCSLPMTEPVPLMVSTRGRAAVPEGSNI